MRGNSAAARRLLGIVASSLLIVGCPKQELAELNPCTVSGVSEQIRQEGLSAVDLLFVIDDSGSMASEQLKLAEELPRLIRVLTTGDRFAGGEAPPGISGEQRYFTKVSSLQVGVISTNMGGIDDPKNGEPAACAGLGDDGKLLRRIEVARDGVVARALGSGSEFDGFAVGETVLPADPSCDIAMPPKYQQYDASTGGDADALATAFSCVSRVGVRGCAFEQQLEAMWKALAPSSGSGARYQFLNDTKGHGDGYNAGFLRDDAILAVIHVSDEEDCSIKPEGKDLFRLTPAANERFTSQVNVRCAKYGDREGLVWPTQRYIEGLKTLKPDFPDRVIFGAIVGIPESENGSNDFDAILSHPDMQFEEARVANTLRARPSCRRERDGKVDDASPPRRFVEVAKGLGDNSVLWSICSDDYGPALDRLIERIASKLAGDCLPRQLSRDRKGQVPCEVVELLAEGEERCSPERGHEGGPITHTYRDSSGKQVTARACAMKQVRVMDKKPEPGARGWYYDDFASDLETECSEGFRQRIAFQFAEAGTSLPPGAGAAYACFQSITRTEGEQEGLGAVNTSCDVGGDDACAARSNGDDGGYDLQCVQGKCQIGCAVTPDCPGGWVCATARAGTADGPSYCQLPTCPQQD